MPRSMRSQSGRDLRRRRRSPVERRTPPLKRKKLAELKAEKPGLRKQQYDDLLSKLWARSPQNPANQQK
jgi:hypothetical protein